WGSPDPHEASGILAPGPRSSADRAADCEAACVGSTPPGAIQGAAATSLAQPRGSILAMGAESVVSCCPRCCPRIDRLEPGFAPVARTDAPTRRSRQSHVGALQLARSF